MRDIKFRVWDGGSKKMWEPETPSFDGSDTFLALYNDKAKTIGWGWYDRRLENRLVSGAYEGNILMQFTGLKDKNGKEIYEGDIVKWETTFFDFDKPDGEERTPVTKIGTIEWRGKGFWVDKEDFGWEGEDLWTWEQLEIIGNIYENPELIIEPNAQVSDTNGMPKESEA